MLDDFLRLLAGETPDGVVWTADLSYWITGRKQAGVADPDWDDEEGYLQFHRDLGVMPYYYYPRFWAAKAVYDGTIEVRTEHSDRRRVTVHVTPVGELREESAFLPESCCEGITRHPVNTADDLDVMLYLLEHRHLEPCNLDNYAGRLELWRRYDGLPCLGLPRSPLSSLCYEWAGVQNLVYLMLDAEDRILQVLHLLEEQEQPIIEAVCELAPPLVHFPDNLSSDNLTSYYDTHMAASHRRRLEKLHRAGTRCAVHLDGTVKGLLPKLVQSGFDAVEALTPQPAGDLTVAEMQELAGSRKVILWGGAPGAMFAAPYSWSDVQRHVQEVLAVWSGRPFVLGVADQVPPDGNIEFCRKIAAMVNP